MRIFSIGGGILYTHNHFKIAVAIEVPKGGCSCNLVAGCLRPSRFGFAITIEHVQLAVLPTCDDFIGTIAI
jgi:hypothetical protein